ILVTKTVIPAKAGIQKDKKTRFRVKPGMTIKVTELIAHYTSHSWKLADAACIAGRNYLPES
ncbi:MAG: hypothetical protein AB1487_10560, partial [Thermodesulfobacteriota bacterium]